MTILVFGGVGFIGTNICKLATEQGHKVFAFDNLMRPGVTENLEFLRKQKNFKFIYGDMRNQGDFKNLPKNIDGIINVGGNASVPKSILTPKLDFESNVIGQLNILDFSRKNGKIPVVFASSSKVYTDRVNKISLLETKLRYKIREKKFLSGFDEYVDVDGVDEYTNSFYGVSKLAAEKYSREYYKHFSVPVVVNRMSCIYGLFQKGTEDQGWVDWFIRAKKYQQTIIIYGNGKQVRDVLWGTDLADLYLTQLKNIKKYQGKVFNVGGGPKNGFNISLLELIQLLDENYPGPKIKIKFKDWRPSDQQIYISNINKLTKITGWEPKIPIKKGVDKIWLDMSRPDHGRQNF